MVTDECGSCLPAVSLSSQHVGKVQSGAKKMGMRSTRGLSCELGLARAFPRKARIYPTQGPMTPVCDLPEWSLALPAERPPRV